MEQISVTVQYFTDKVSKVKWLPEELVREEASLFVTGSYRETGHNTIGLHSWPSEDEGKVRTLSSTSQTGGVTDLMCLDDRIIISTSSNGDVNLFSYNHHDLQKVHAHNKLHHFKDQSASSCNSVSTNRSGLVVTGGDDGVLNVLTPSHSSLSLSSSIEADLASITAVHFISHSTVACVNSVSQLKLYDVRVQHKRLPTPEKQYSLPSLQSLHSIEQHPGQPHVLLMGGSAGVVFSVDVRMLRSPLCALQGGEGDVWQVSFHHLLPDNIFSCSQGGSLLYTSLRGDLGASSESWVLEQTSKKQVLVRDLMPDNHDSVNSFDIAGNRLVCGLDNFQVCLIEGLNVC